jgi:glycosyltransferase involved in cell wall biosynthesis
MSARYRLAILATHPIQYHAAWYRALADHPGLDVHVYYCHQATPKEQADAGFGVEFDWDVPLLAGYPHTFLKNVASRPDVNRFNGLDTPEIKNIVQSGRYDAVVINGWHYKSAWQAIWACRRTGVKVAVRSDSHLHTPRRLPTRLAKALLYPEFIPRFDACLAVGKWSREYFLHYGAKAESVFFVPHAVDHEFFHGESGRLQPSRSELRKNWSLRDDAVVFLFAGKFIAKKRPLDFVRAIALAARQDQRIQGLMVGDGPFRAECELWAQTHQAPANFVGFLNQSQITAAYVVCDALVLPSDGGETWGLVVNEAMECGRPCVVSDHVGCGPDLVLAGETGAIFPLGDVDVLAKTLIEIADPARLAAMGTQARKKIHDYSLPIAVDGIVNCLDAMLNRRHARTK